MLAGLVHGWRSSMSGSPPAYTVSSFKPTLESENFLTIAFFISTINRMLWENALFIFQWNNLIFIFAERAWYSLHAVWKLIFPVLRSDKTLDHEDPFQPSNESVWCSNQLPNSNSVSTCQYTLIIHVSTAVKTLSRCPLFRKKETMVFFFPFF